MDYTPSASLFSFRVVNGSHLETAWRVRLLALANHLV